MDFSKEINDVVRKSINHRNLSNDFEGSVAYSESLCNELADKIQKLVEEKFTPINKQSVEMPCPSKLFPEWKIMEADWKRGAHAMYRALASHFTHLS